MSAGANGEVVQWQAFFFLPPPPYLGPPPPALSTHNTAAEIHLSHHGKDRDQSGPRLRRVAGTTEHPASDDQPDAAADGVDMDYQTTLAREDEGEISLSGLLPFGKEEGRGGGEMRGNGAATTGQMPNAFAVGVGPAVEAGSSVRKSEGQKENDPAATETERGRKGGASPDAGAGPRVEVRPDRETQGRGGAEVLWWDRERACCGVKTLRVISRMKIIDQLTRGKARKDYQRGPKILLRLLLPDVRGVGRF